MEINAMIYGKGAFLYCDSLKTFTLPKSLKTIGEEAFRETDLKDVSVPDSVTEIGQKAFPEGCCTETRTPGQEPKESSGIL
ncbi:MAG: leucine-rich repeat domain-containing protein [Firmicutes bacterium]|nr:leucine-rich repeat domain-containing protein [Bacillota bacterium]